MPFRVLIDGEPPGDAHGLNVDEQGRGPVAQQRLNPLRSIQVVWTARAPATRQGWRQWPDLVLATPRSTLPGDGTGREQALLTPGHGLSSGLWLTHSSRNS
jgi:hypothetical protein